MGEALAIVETEQHARKLSVTMFKWFGGDWTYQKEENGFCLYVSNLPDDKQEKMRYFLIGYFVRMREEE